MKFYLSCDALQRNAVLHGHGRVDSAAAAGSTLFWGRGRPSGTGGGSSSISTDHLGTEAIHPNRGGGGGDGPTASQGHGVSHIGSCEYASSVQCPSGLGLPAHGCNAMMHSGLRAQTHVAFLARLNPSSSRRTP
ncbi:hypothetical protein EYF80_052565 [Liparis tanakae]|uniref:Uncharacterized protein n=1 Tax=Liparis tanakae TaxID=230148 RepID=A0A4Z2F7Q1_9TELE|nr:hypothetical protein EYF80_052565 [Liparis tanakae]